MAAGRSPLALRPQMPAGATSLAVSSSSARVALPGSSSQVRLSTLAGDAVVFLDFVTSTGAAVVATGIQFNPGNTETFSAPISATHIAAITSSGTATLYVTPGEGM